MPPGVVQCSRADSQTERSLVYWEKKLGKTKEKEKVTVRESKGCVGSKHKVSLNLIFHWIIAHMYALTHLIFTIRF